MARPTDKNLIPNSQRTPEELREMTIKGGKKSGEVRRKKRDTRQIIEAILESKAPDQFLDKFKQLFPNVKGKSIEDILNMAIIKKGMSGDVSAYNALMDRKDGKPQQRLDHTSKGKQIFTDEAEKKIAKRLLKKD